MGWGRPQGTFGNIWEEMRLAAGGKRPGRLLNTVQQAGQPPQAKNYPAQNVNSAETEQLHPVRWQNRREEEPGSLKDHMPQSCPPAWTGRTVDIREINSSFTLLALPQQALSTCPARCQCSGNGSCTRESASKNVLQGKTGL